MMLRFWIHAMSAWRRPRAWGESLALLLLWCALAWWWLSLPVATAFDAALLVLVALAALALPAWVLWRARSIWKQPRVYAALPLALAASLALPWLLIRWVPPFESFMLQALSAAVRFTLAAVCFAGPWLWLGEIGRRPAPESRHGNCPPAQ
jgi:hypothetical protein